MPNFKLPIYFCIISALVYLLSACEGGPGIPNNSSVRVSFTVDCVQLVCAVDVSNTISDSDALDSLLCDMGDGNQIDALLLAPAYDYTYAAPALYAVICRGKSKNGVVTAVDTVSVNVDGVIVNAGPDQTVSSGTTVTLDGSTSEAQPDSPINLYRWRNLETNLPQLAIVSTDTVSPTFFAPDENVTKTYRVSLTVSIDGGVNFSNSSDIVDITVIPAGGSDLPQ